MIRQESFTKEWIDKVSTELNYKDKNLIEKVILYQIAYRGDTDVQSYILLDVLYEDTYYSHTQQVAIDSPFVSMEDVPLMVRVPSTEDILGDKLTAFAPNTSGIPYYKGDKCCSMEIIKQLYDVGRLFEQVNSLETTSKTFTRLGKWNCHIED